MRRRTLLLGVTGVPAGACKAPVPSRYLLTVTTADGVSVVDDAGRVVRGPRAVSAATPDWGRTVSASPAGPDTRVAVEDRRSEPAVVTLRGRLEPRIVSPDGRLVASVTPGGAGVHGLHEPGGRDRTTIVVSGAEGELYRLDLPGNLEPEAFSPDDERLYVLDFLPPGKPERYRAAVVDLRAGRLTPIDAEPTRANRVVRVHDERRGRLFAICAREGEAYVHCIDLAMARARRIDLPSPFGGGRPGVHGLALSQDRLCAVHSLSAKVAEIDPDRLVLKRVTTFAGSPQDGKPGVAFTRDGRLVVSVDGKLLATDPDQEISTPGEPRGLVIGPAGEVWAGHPGGVVRFDLSRGVRTGQVRIPGLYVLKQVSDA